MTEISLQCNVKLFDSLQSPQMFSISEIFQEGFRGCLKFNKHRVFQKSLCKSLGSLFGSQLSELQIVFGNMFQKVTHSMNTLRLAKSEFIFSNERSFFTFFVPLPWMDHTPFQLLVFILSRFEMPEKIRALARLVF